MRTLLLLTLVVSVCYAQVSNEYFAAFSQIMGIDGRSVEEDVDCGRTISEVLHSVKSTLERDYRDVDLLIEAAIEFVDKLKYEVSPSCKTLTGDFDDLMQGYYGEADSLREDIETNLDKHHARVSREINCALIAIKMGHETDGGRLHANVLRMLLGLTVSDLTINQAVLEEEKRTNEEMRSDKGHFSVQAAKSGVDSTDFTIDGDDDDENDNGSTYTNDDMPTDSQDYTDPEDYSNEPGMNPRLLQEL